MMGREPARRFDAAGPSGANVILFVHGARMTRKMWLPQMQALADRYRVVALDLPGHGALAGMRFGLEAAVQVAADVIEQEASGRALLVGSSLGGYVSLELASRHPNKVAGLVLSGCTAFVAAAPDARLQVIRWGSHRCSLERPEAFTDAVRRFARAIGW